MENKTETVLMLQDQRPPVPMVRGKGSWLWDAEGTRYLDFVQGWAVNCLGHAPPAIRRALSCQSGQLINPSPGFLNEPQLELARALTLASGLGQAFFCSTGAEANEGAVKLARKWGQRHRSGAYKVITTHGSFHGRTLAMTAASGKAGWENLFAPMMPGFVKVPYGDAQAVYQAIDPATVAVMVEPIQGEAGVRVPPAGYLQALREMTSQHGILLIFDEVQTGIARTGTMFAYEQEGVRPDVLTLAKGLGGGLPLAALLASHATCCFEPGEQGGAFCGTPIMTLPQPIAADVVGWCREHGLLLNSPAPSVLRFLPALNVQRREINAMATILIAALHALLPQNTTRK